MTTSFRHYENFDLDISKIENGYCARVLASPAGEGDITFHLPFSDEDLSQSNQLLTEAIIKAVSDGGNKPSTYPLSDPRALGKFLFEQVFTGIVSELFTQSLVDAKRRKSGLRIRLRLTHAPQLAALPWEYLYDARRRRYFCRSIQTPLVRYLELPYEVEPLQVKLPLRILVAISSPNNVGAALDVEQEWQTLVDALADLQARKVVVLERCDTPTIENLQHRIQHGSAVHILHFIGHGTSDASKGSSGLFLEDENNQGVFVTAELLCEVLADHEPHLIFLNSCEGATLSFNNPLSGTAQQLVQQGVPAVIAMQFIFSDHAATTLTQEFYQALAEGNPVDTALAEARKRVAVSGNEIEWGTPVLFMRAADGYLFDVAAWLPVPACPYPGMLPYTADDQAKFYGRSNEIEEALLQLRDDPVLMVIGASGVGKSSLVFAGIVPQFCQTSWFGKAEWQVQSMRPGVAPLTALATLLGLTPQSLKPGEQSEEAQSTQSSTAIPIFVPGDGAKLILVIDQFEELFTQSEAVEARDFQTALRYLIHTRLVYLVMTMRADFYENLLTSPLWEEIKDHRLELKPLDAQGLREAILQPAEAVDVQIDPSLVERLLADAANEPGVMPLIQETLVLLWARVKNRFLSVNAYTDLTRHGPKRTGLQVAIARRADCTLQTLAEDAHPIARRVFLRLVQFGEGRNDTRRQQPLSALSAWGDDAALFEKTIGHLVSARLLTISGSEQTESDRLDIAHEALITGWPTFQSWLTKSRKAEQSRRELEAKADEWERRKRQGAFLDQMEWQEAQNWMQSEAAHELGCSQNLYELLATSEQRLRRQMLKHRLTQAAVVVILLLLGVAGLLGLRAIAVAEEAERSESRRIANFAYQDLLVDPVQSLRAASVRLPNATPKPYVPEIEAVTYQALQVNLQRGLLDVSALLEEGKLLTNDQVQAGGRWLAVGGKALWWIDLTHDDPLNPANVITRTAHSEPILALQWDTEQRWLLSRDLHHLRLWQDAQPGAELSLDNEEIHCAAWRPHHEEIAVCSGNSVLLWSPSEKTVIKIADFTTAIHELFWSHDGNWVAMWEEGRGLTATSQAFLIWNAEHHSSYLSLPIETKNYLRKAAWSPDARYFVAALRTKGMQVWEIGKSSQKTTFAEDVRVNEIAFIDPTTFVTWSINDLTRQWSIAGKEIRQFNRSGDHVQGIQLSPDHSQLLTFVERGADLWSLATGERIASFCCHALPILTASWRDEHTLATAGKDGTVRLWSLDAEASGAEAWMTLGGQQNRNGFGRSDLFTVLWLNSQMLLTAGKDGTIRRWQIDDNQGQPLCDGIDQRGIAICHPFSHRFSASLGEIRNLHWVDGKFIALSLNVENQTYQQTEFSDSGIQTHSLIISDTRSPVLFLSDGKSYLSQTNGKTEFIQLEPGSSVTLEAQVNPLASAVIGSDGRLATADQQGKVQVWSLADGKELTHFSGTPTLAEQAPIWELLWSADGQSLLTASRQVARWDVTSGRQQWVSAQSGQTVHMNLSQDQRYLAATMDRQFMIFDADSGELLWSNQESTQPLSGVRWVQVAAWPNQNRHWAWVDGLARRLVGQPFNVELKRQLLLTWGGDGTLRLWDWQKRAEVMRLSETGPIVAAAISPDGSELFSAALLPDGLPGAIRIWQSWLNDPALLAQIAQQ